MQLLKEFFIDLILPAVQWPWVQLSLQEKSVPGILLGDKGGLFVGLTNLPHSCGDCLEVWEPQPPRTLGAYPRSVYG